MNFARGIIKHRGDLRYADTLGRADLTAWRASAEEAVPFPVTIHRRFARCRCYRRDTHLEGASFEHAAEEPATANGFREPRMQDTRASTMTFM
jgi:hypothetical protein